MSRPCHTIPLAAAVLAFGLAAAPAQAWWHVAWTARRAVAVADYKPTKLPGDDVAVVTLPTGGLCKADGSDIRVAGADDQEVPCRVLMMGPGDVARVAFALRGGGTKYFVYFGNPKAEPRKEELEIRRGVLLEMWEFPGGAIRTFPQVADVLRRAKNLLGRDFRDRIWSGHNPFGPQSAIAAVYTGWLRVAAEGEYAFAISSMNASFLLVDGNVLIGNGGQHAPQGNVSRGATIRLSPGLTKLTFYHASGGGDPIAVVAWRPPGEADKRKFTFVPPGAFAPTFRAAPGMLEVYGRPSSVDFLYEHTGEAFVANRYYQRFTFWALAGGSAPRALQWKWDFGDGQTSTEEKPQHVYLVPGEYKVTLTAGSGAAALSRTNRLFVSRPWDRVTDSRLDGIREQAAIVAKYDFNALPAPAAAEAVILFHRVNQEENVLKAGEALAAATQPVRAALIEEALPHYVKAMVAAGKADAAVAALQKAAAANAASPAASAALLTEAGQIALESQADPKRAADIFQQVIRKNAALAGPLVIRRAKIGLGDVERFLGDYDKAKKAYEDARTRPVDRPGGAPFLKGDYARHVEEYTRTRDYASAYDYLREWGEAFPLDKLEGFWSLLRARLAYERGRFAAATREADLLVKINPRSNYAPELLLQAADAWEKLKDPAKAAGALRQIVKDYPESALAADAAKRLRK